VVALLAGIVTTVLAAAGCTGSPDSPGPGAQVSAESPFDACPPSTASAPTGPDALPAVTLPCFTGGEPVALDRLGRPAVINLWASWCTPCRAELPQLQAFADEAGDRVLVLGVVTDDVWDRAASIADYGVHFPAVFDPESTLKRALGRPGLPVTLFVAADGSVRATDVSGALTVERLRALAGEHLGYAP
jgi:thiol-disulfide isomerase/thioredoxin